MVATILTAHAAPAQNEGKGSWKVVRDTALDEPEAAPPAPPPVGVGLVLSCKRGETGVVTRVVRDSPAAAVGIRPGCVLEKVRGRPVAGMGSRAIAEALQGKAGTKVTVTVRFPGLDAVADYDLERQPLALPLRFTDSSDDDR